MVTFTFDYVDDNYNQTIYESPDSNIAAAAVPPLAPIRSGFNQNVIAANDDNEGITNLLASIGFPIKYFGTIYTNLYVNNNGNVTFNTNLDTFTPVALATLHTNIIAPFWTDVDTRTEGYYGGNSPPFSGLVTYGASTVITTNNGTIYTNAAFGVTWPYVGYFNVKTDKLNVFQLVLIARPDRASGDYDVEFNYGQIQWETGDASRGSDGLGGYSARAGCASASGSTFELNGSGVPGSFLDSNPTTGLIHTNYNSGGILGRYVYQFHNGTNSLARP